MTLTNKQEAEMYVSVLVNNWKGEPEFIAIMTPTGDIEFDDVSGNKTAVIKDFQENGIKDKGEILTTDDGIDFLWAITYRYSNSSRVAASVPSQTQERPSFN